MYLKNADENYIRVEPLENSAVSEGKLESNGVDGADQLYCTDSSHQPAPSQQTRSGGMIEQLTQGLVQLTLEGESLGTIGPVSPWASLGEWVRWGAEPPLPLGYSQPIEMPSRTVQEQWIDVFFCQPALFPLISRNVFYEQLAIKGPLISPILLQIIYAHAAHAQQQNVEADHSYQRARRLLDDFLDQPRISTVIALIYLTLFEIKRNQNTSRAWMYSGMAIRMCLELGLHTSRYSSQMSQCDIELRKRVLWSCYVMDKYASGTLERPMMLQAGEINLDLPHAVPEDSRSERFELEAFNQLCRLMMVLEKVIHLFSAPDPPAHSLEPAALAFLDTLAHWREQLPVELAKLALPPCLAHLHLLAYNLELSLLMCCQDPVYHERRDQVISHLRHLLHLPHPLLPQLVAFSTLLIALAYLPQNNHHDQAKARFKASLEDIRMLAQRGVVLPDLRPLARLIDLTFPAYPLVPKDLFPKEDPYLFLDSYPASSAHSSPSSVAAITAAAAAAVGAVGTPAASHPCVKSIEPADYTFELISVADEWAQSLLY
ncbi:fungal-specific transcription factor domain-containing protein [Sporodiniella umbellata]|nr:fungal-specific transcription factor domain-containing protein [Sporodiniella umbellata]